MLSARWQSVRHPQLWNNFRKSASPSFRISRYLFASCRSLHQSPQARGKPSSGPRHSNTLKNHTMSQLRQGKSLVVAEVARIRTWNVSSCCRVFSSAMPFTCYSVNMCEVTKVFTSLWLIPRLVQQQLRQLLLQHVPRCLHRRIKCW